MPEAAPDHTIGLPTVERSVQVTQVQTAEANRNKALQVVDTDYENRLAFESSPEYISAMEKLRQAGSRGIYCMDLKELCTPEEQHIIIMEAHLDIRQIEGLHYVHKDLFRERKPLPPEAALSK